MFHSSKEVIYGIYHPVATDLIVWCHGNTIQGHIGTVLKDWEGTAGYTIEGNANNGVRIEWREIQITVSFRIIGFIHLE